MLSDIGQNEKIARFRTKPAAMAFLRDPNARARINASRDPDLDLLRFWGCSLSVTQRTRGSPPAGPIAVGAILRKLQSSAGFQNLAGAFAGRTLNDRAACITGTLAAGALLGPIDCNIRS
jgi:hypothetical protein